MNMKKSNIDCCYFLGQVDTEVNIENNLPLGMSFNKGKLNVECPWRLRIEKERVK